MPAYRVRIASFATLMLLDESGMCFTVFSSTLSTYRPDDEGDRACLHLLSAKVKFVLDQEIKVALIRVTNLSSLPHNFKQPSLRSSNCSRIGKETVMYPLLDITTYPNQVTVISTAVPGTI